MPNTRVTRAELEAKFAEDEKGLEAWQNAFSDGFADAAPEGYDAEGDSSSGAPWCAPWTWDNDFPYDNDAYAAGMRFAQECHDDLAEIIAATPVEDEE